MRKPPNPYRQAAIAILSISMMVLAAELILAPACGVRLPGWAVFAPWYLAAASLVALIIIDGCTD